MDELIVLSMAALYLFWKRKIKTSSVQQSSPFSFSIPILDLSVNPTKDQTSLTFSVGLPMSMSRRSE